jgi:pimeloyl-ACP methyl ester carboxylesterase
MRPRSLIDPSRRRLIASAVTLAAAPMALSARAFAQPAPDDRALTPAPVDHIAFASLKRVDAGLLSIAYAEAGPADGPPVVLLHGWPYDIHSYVDVAPMLADKGLRVIVPYLRGFGPTRFLSDATFRNGQQSAIALDVIKLMDALNIQRAVVAGYDWGARTADIVAALWPERCRALVSVSGYLIVNLEANKQPLPPQAELGWWYQYYFATERGRLGYERNRHDFNRLIWKIASPNWAFDDATFERTAAAFDNPDHVAIVIHNYRWRQSLADGERAYDALEARLQASPAISTPSLTIGSDFDAAAADGAPYARRFTGPYAHWRLRGIGHNVPQEAPRAFADAVLAAAALAPRA